MSEPGATYRSASQCGCHSARAVFKVAGDFVAIPHKVPQTGYKAKNAYGTRPIFEDETTNKGFQRTVRAVGQEHGLRKKLEPYSPTAPRNRPKETMENTVGCRHRLHPVIKHEKYRGSSQIKLRDGDPESARPWKTTNQVFAECTQARNTTGLTNPGISSRIARVMHKKQGIYDSAGEM
ncbi:hypothetical protein WJX74_002994 [Apatococcus lobatus]|uniref:Uncharacterized protein n=2 Tax=Apatococcus TaxID=904362 RepID=A0AAW1T582_9CHLO